MGPAFRPERRGQATLYHHEPERICEQVRWLGRVLPGRGMPTFLLADQLEILVEELAAAIPEKRSACEKLLPAAAELRESRRRHLNDVQIQAIAPGLIAPGVYQTGGGTRRPRLSRSRLAKLGLRDHSKQKLRLSPGFLRVHHRPAQDDHPHKHVFIVAFGTAASCAFRNDYRQRNRTADCGAHFRHDWLHRSGFQFLRPIGFAVLSPPARLGRSKALPIDAGRLDDGDGVDADARADVARRRGVVPRHVGRDDGILSVWKAIECFHVF